MLIFRSTDWYQGLSAEQMQQIADNWMGWFNRLKDEGKAIAGNPLEREGKIVSGKNRAVSDGPFAESKEVLGGYWMIEVNSKQEAIEWAKKCPATENEIIEIRQVQEMSDFSEEVQQAAAGFSELQQGSSARR